MKTRYTVDLDHLDDVATRLRGVTEFIEGHLNELESRLAALHLTWTGTTAINHAEAHRKWELGARDVRDGLVGMQDALKLAREGYQSAIDANLRMLGRR